MLSPLAPYSLLKMHWSPEHAAPLSQWPEQHLDVSSTTSPPSAQKHEAYPTAARRGYGQPGYPWASDDISALTASSLLKRYAEKYSGLELSYDRPPPAGAYSEPGTFLKTESEPWALGQGVDCYPGLEGLGSAKVGSAAVGIPATGSVTVVSNLPSDPVYSGPCTAPSTQEYPPAYNSATYLSSGYCPQPGASLPPAPLHSLQPSPALVPSYSASAPVYNYPPGCYPQSGLSSSYSHPSASYLPSGISAPTPLAPRPTIGGSYSYPSHSLAGTSESGVPLKRKAFEMSEEGQEGADGENSRYRKYGNGHSKGNGYELTKTVMSPPYGGAGDYSPPSGMQGENVSGDHSFPQQRMPMKIPATHARPDDTTGGR